MRREMRLRIIAVMHKKRRMPIPCPVAGEAGTETLREHEHMVTTVRSIPVRMLVDDMIHSARKEGTRTVDVVRQMRQQVAGGEDGDVEKVGEFRIGCANGGSAEMLGEGVLSAVERLVAERVADLRWV